jgi:hypothetical protein
MTENCKFRKAILSAFYNISQRNFGILLILWCSFKLWWNFCLDQNLVYNANGPLRWRICARWCVFYFVALKFARFPDLHEYLCRLRRERPCYIKVFTVRLISRMIVLLAYEIYCWRHNTSWLSLWRNLFTRFYIYIPRIRTGIVYTTEDRPP